MATEIAAEFILTGVGFNPDDVTASLGIQPTKTWRVGEQTGKTLLRYKHDGWMLSTGYQELDEEKSVDVISQLRFIYERLKPYTGKLKEVCKQFQLEVELVCVLYIEDDDRPAVHFSRDIVKWLAELKADIDIDLYIRPSENV